MSREGPTTDTFDPLGGIDGPLLFPRTIRESDDVPVPTDTKNLDSIHNFMKSLKNLRSPEKLMNEAKRIVDGGAKLLESDLASCVKNVGIAAKGKDKPRERRPGLDFAHKRPRFSLKTNISHPPVCSLATLNKENLEDPDDFFDAYERVENANKEIQKQLGISVDNFKPYKSSNNARRRRPGLLGKSYTYKHQYSTEVPENDVLVSSQETVDLGTPIAPQDKSPEKLVVELADATVSAKKKENGLSDTLEELLSCNIEDLEGDGALNLLQERLMIKPIDLEDLCRTELPGVGRTIKFSSKEPDVGRTIKFSSKEPDVGSSSISPSTESLQKCPKSSMIISSVLKNLTRKSSELKPLQNPVSSPTPLKSPFASISLMQKRILQSTSVRDIFSPTDADLFECQNVSPAEPKHGLLDPVDAAKDSGQSTELESCVEVDNAEPPVADNPASSPTPSRSSFASISLLQKRISQSSPTRDNSSPINVNLSASQNVSTAQPNHKLPDQVDDAPKNFGLSIELESCVDVDNAEAPVSNIDLQEVTETANGLPQEFVPDKLHSSVLEVEATEDTSNRHPTDLKEQPEVHRPKQPREKGVGGRKHIKKAHPMRKSLAEAGTSFETGVRRSKRIKMRPLEYWKGERFLYGRIDDSLKLLGVKYFSPGKDTNDLKVKPYIMSGSSEYKELLDLAARH